MSAAEKKGPGRPKKKIDTNPENDIILGIANAPATHGAVAELIYRTPSYFKRIFSYFHSISVDHCRIKFDATKMIIEGEDHHKEIKNRIEVKGDDMNSYFCAAPIEIVIKTAQLMDNIFNSSTDKRISTIKFILKDNHRSSLYIITLDYALGLETEYELNVVNEPVPIIPIYNAIDYPVIFKISSKDLKSLVNGISRNSENFSIEKIGTGPLTIVNNDAKEGVDVTRRFLNSAKIALMSTINESDIFHITLSRRRISSFASTDLSDGEVTIYADKRREIVFLTSIGADVINITVAIQIVTA